MQRGEGLDSPVETSTDLLKSASAGQALRMTTARELLELIHDYVTERSGEASPDRLQSIAQRFDVALGEALLDRTSLQNEG